MKKVLVGTPSYNGDVCCDYALGLAEACRLASSKGYEIRAKFLMYNSMIAQSRNVLLADAYHGEYDDFIFIDSDQGFTAGSLFKLLSHPVDVVGFPVRSKVADLEIYNVMPNDDFSKYLPDVKLGLLSVPAVGTGMFRLSKKAVKDIFDSSKKYQKNGVMVPHACRSDFDPDTGIMTGEDIYLCNRLRELGYSIYVDPSFTPDHFGRHKFSGSFHAHLIKSLSGKKE